MRPTFDRWYAMVLLLDERAAPDVAALVDRSPAWSVNGAAPDIAPLIPLLQRRKLRRCATLGRHGLPGRRHRGAGRRHPPREQGRPRRARRAVLDVRVRRRTDGLAAPDDAASRARSALRHRRRVAGRRARFAGARGDHDADASIRRARPAHRRAGPSWCRAGRGRSSRTRSRSATRSASPASRRLAGSNPMDLDAHVRDDHVRRGRARAAATVPRARSPARASTVVGSRCSPRAPGLVPRTGRPVGARSDGLKLTRTRAERWPSRPPLPIVFVQVVQLIEPWPLPLGCRSEPCRSSASTLSRDSTAGRSYCMSCSFRRGVICSPRRTTHCSDHRSWIARFNGHETMSIACRFRHAAARFDGLGEHLTTESAICARPTPHPPDDRPKRRLHTAATSSLDRAISRRRRRAAAADRRHRSRRPGRSGDRARPADRVIGWHRPATTIGRRPTRAPDAR